MKFNATEAFAALVQASAALHQSGWTRELGMRFDEELGRIVAQHAIQSGATQQDVWMFANIMYDYGMEMALMRFCYEVEGDGFNVPYDFEGGETAKPGHPGHDLRAAMDIKAMAKRGRQIGWQAAWCPFRGPAEQAWFEGFRDDISL